MTCLAVEAQTAMRPLVSYYGGKQRLARWIVSLLPPHTVYCEPFAGGAAVFFAKGRPTVTNSHHYREVLNDHDASLITTYRCCQQPETRQALLERLRYTPYSRAEHQRAYQLLRDPNASPLDRAWAKIVKIQQSFANVEHGGWKTGVFGRNDAATWHRWLQDLDAIFDRLIDVYLECDDALAVMARWDSPQTCFYLDPPYPGADQGHYAGYTLEDWARLVDAMQRCQGSIVCSGYPQSIEPRGHGWERFERQARCSASGQGQVGPSRARSRRATPEELGDRRRTEVVWRIDRSAGMRQELRWARHRQADLFAEDHP